VPSRPSHRRIVIAIAAVVLSLSGGAYAASVISGQHARPAVAASSNTFTFHNLTLVNGWSQFFHRGQPGYAVSGNTVRLRGEMTTTGNNTLFATLPRGARPAHAIDIPIATGGAVAGPLLILKNGQMFAEGTNLASFSALSGVSFTTNS